MRKCVTLAISQSQCFTDGCDGPLEGTLNFSKNLQREWQPGLHFPSTPLQISDRYLL